MKSRSSHKSLSWIHRLLDGPFTEEDSSLDLVEIKVLRQAQVPDLVSIMLSAIEQHDRRLPLLRLCSFDDLERAAIALAPVASGKSAFEVRADTLNGLQNITGEIIIEAMCLLGTVLNEIEHRRKRGYTEDKYQHEWEETHTAWMVELKAAQQRRSRLCGK
jgi:hypothetical protein